MGIRTRVQKLVERLPERLSAPIVHMPFSVRLGSSYSQQKRCLQDEERAGLAFDSQGRWQSLRDTVRFASEHTTFYRNWFADHRFDPESLQSWDDWDQVPIVTRDDLQRSPLQDRCVYGARGMKVNTGGTSGQPLEFLLDPDALGREWAHMHFIWSSHGYRQTHRKLTLRGKHFEPGRALRFNPVNNEYLANSNVPMRLVVDAAIEATRRKPIRWVHGYPSLAAEFASELATRSPASQREFRDRLFGVLLGSEFPAPQYRDPISSVLSSNVVSWYGHSEMVLLARETALGVYSTFPTYGFAEAVPAADGTYRLVCTSIANRTHPFIRYDTGDLVAPICVRRGALEFAVTEGRVGDFITDRNGCRHGLTAVIFGRHHAAFELVRHLQVYQAVQGEATIVATPREPGLSAQELARSMDLAGLDVAWSVKIVEQPLRTRSGKIRLKLGPGDMEFVQTPAGPGIGDQASSA